MAITKHYLPSLQRLTYSYFRSLLTVRFKLPLTAPSDSYLLSIQTINYLPLSNISLPSVTLSVALLFIAEKFKYFFLRALYSAVSDLTKVTYLSKSLYRCFETSPI